MFARMFLMIGSSPIGTAIIILSLMRSQMQAEEPSSISQPFHQTRDFELEKMYVREMHQQSTAEERSIHQETIFDLMDLSRDRKP
jgi:hypothetical protein